MGILSFLRCLLKFVRWSFEVHWLQSTSIKKIDKKETLITLSFICQFDRIYISLLLSSFENYDKWRYLSCYYHCISHKTIHCKGCIKERGYKSRLGFLYDKDGYNNLYNSHSIILLNYLILCFDGTSWFFALGGYGKNTINVCK